METLSVLMTLCEEYSAVTGEEYLAVTGEEYPAVTGRFPSQRLTDTALRKYLMFA